MRTDCSTALNFLFNKRSVPFDSVLKCLGSRSYLRTSFDNPTFAVCHVIIEHVKLSPSITIVRHWRNFDFVHCKAIHAEHIRLLLQSTFYFLFLLSLTASGYEPYLNLILSYLILLCYLILSASYLISYIILCYISYLIILSYLIVLSYLILYYLILSYLILSYRRFWLTLYAVAQQWILTVGVGWQSFWWMFNRP